MDQNDMSQEDMQQIWNEEASKLEAGNIPAEELKAAVPDVDEDNLDETPQETPVEPEVEAAPQEDEDPLASLPEAVREKLALIDKLAEDNAQLLHHVKTAEGRVAAMQREFEQARRASAQVAPQDAPSQTQISSAAKNPEKWEQLKQDFPEWAGAMEEYVAAKLSNLPQSDQGISPEQVTSFVERQMSQLKLDTARAIEEARIEGKYEDWRDIVNTTDFAQWFAVQAADVRALADSPVAKDAIKMLDMFHKAKERPVSEIKQERGARLAAAATTKPGVTPPPKTMDDMTPEELWNYEAAKREKQRAKQGF